MKSLWIGASWARMQGECVNHLLLHGLVARDVWDLVGDAQSFRELPSI